MSASSGNASSHASRTNRLTSRLSTGQCASSNSDHILALSSQARSDTGSSGPSDAPGETCCAPTRPRAAAGRPCRWKDLPGLPAAQAGDCDSGCAAPHRRRSAAAFPAPWPHCPLPPQTPRRSHITAHDTAVLRGPGPVAVSYTPAERARGLRVPLPAADGLSATRGIERHVPGPGAAAGTSPCHRRVAEYGATTAHRRPPLPAAPLR